MTIDFVTRGQWGARPPRQLAHRTYDQITASVIHYADLPVHATLPDEEAAVRGIQRFHMDAKGWADIGYHYLVGMTGTVYEGRPLYTVGAHCEGFNTPSFGVCFLTADGITPVAGAACVNLIQLVEYVTLHHKVAILAHREKRPTHCPGDKLFTWIVAVRSPGGPLS